KQAMDKVIAHYGERRDIPDGQTTSRLSQDLRFGTVSIRELHARATVLQLGAPAAVAGSIDSWINELAWREFYMQILWRFPDVLSLEFDPKFRGLPWEYDESKLERWKTGTTGFPMVDAGMRELAATGFMHNRVRMITAMFLTKDLRLDWRLGEQYFMQALTDGEIASNNGGWQWSAGTGADAAPYFRIQNPWTQAKRFDPEARYIRRWVPELAAAPSDALFAPQVTGIPGARSYPRPMLDHSEERDRTLAMFKRHREQTAGA
ncbi:MAG: cryptochrome/photolyase family protein, partial [Verrucomicrobiota bacterium]